MKKFPDGVIAVGKGGRGFVVKAKERPDYFVITAAHCLRKLPPPHPFSYLEERTYKDLLAPLGQKPLVWCECVFVDPVADIAVLAQPDNQALSEQAEKYDALVEATTPFTIAEPPSKPDPEEVAQLATLKGLTNRVRMRFALRRCPAFLLSLTNEWFTCTVKHHRNGALSIHDAAKPIVGGMSGSPIVAKSGAAIGIVCISSGTSTDADMHTEGGPNPRLRGNLPGWLLTALGAQ